MNSRGSGAIIFIVILSFAVIAGIFIYGLKRIRENKSPFPLDSLITQPTAKPLKEKSGALQSYSDPDGEYTLKFPESFKPGPAAGHFATYFSKEYFFSLNIGHEVPLANKSFASIDEYVGENIADYKDIRKIDLGGKPAYKITGTDGKMITVLFMSKDFKSVDNINIIIDANHSSFATDPSDDFDKILSTIKFSY